MDLEAIFVKNLRRIRREKKVTQEKLAELCHTETSYIGQIEIGKRFPSIKMIEKIAEVLETPPYIFFMDVENEQTKSLYNLDTMNKVAQDISDYITSEIKKIRNQDTLK